MPSRMTGAVFLAIEFLLEFLNLIQQVRGVAQQADVGDEQHGDNDQHGVHGFVTLLKVERSPVIVIPDGSSV